MKRLLSILVTLATLLSANAQTVGGWTDAFSRPKVAVVLSGGGAKGVAHISALKAIEEAGLPIDIICGTSMGALIGGLYAIGWSTDELDSLVRTQDWTFLLTDRVSPESLDIDTRQIQNTYALLRIFNTGGSRNDGAGFIRGVNLDRLFDRLLEGYLDSIDFNTLPIPFACVATDVVTNTEIDFHSGYLKRAMRASMSIPGVFSPVRWGDRLLVDGGVCNNYPADIARQMGADIIIGVTVQGDTLSVDEITGALDVILQIIDFNGKEKYNENIAMSDILMTVDVSGYSAASFTREAIDTLIHRGAEEAARHRSELESLCHHIAAIRSKWDTQRTIRKPVGADEAEHNPMTENKLRPSPKPLLYNTLVGVAFRFDNEETGALQIGGRYPFHFGIPMELCGSLRLGRRIRFEVDQFIYPRGVTSPSLSYAYYRNDVDLYSSGVRTYNIKYFQHRLSFMPINSRWRKYKIVAGLVFDYYNFFDPILSVAGNTIELNNERNFSYRFESLLNTEDDWYTPTHGMYFLSTFTYRTDNFLTYHERPGIGAVRTIWRISLTPSRLPNFTFTPSVFGRLLFYDDEIPLNLSNALGSHQQLLDQQLFFPGVQSLTLTEPTFLALQFKFQFKIHKHQFIIARAALARNVDYLEHLTEDWPNLYGFSLGYCYNTFLGPISADLGYSTIAPGLNFYLNIGHEF